MSETIYKIGDVLEDIQTGDKYLIIFTGIEGFSQREYKAICYDTLKTFLFNWVSESFLIKKTKRLGNIDISLLLTGEEPKSGRYKWEVTKEDIEQAQEVEKAWNKAADICDEYDALKAKVKKLTDECESLRNNLKDAAEAYNRQTACHEAWKRGWTECLKTFKYYLGTDEDEE